MSLTFHLEKFDGPLDLLLSLISKNKVSIMDIPIADILEQYLEYLEQMKSFDMHISSDFVAMAAHLTYIKSKMLLPKYDDEEEDPRESLVEAEMGEIGRDIFVKGPERLEKDKSKAFKGQISMDSLLKAINSIVDRAERTMPPKLSKFSGIVGKEKASVNEKIGIISRMFIKNRSLSLTDLVLSAKSRSDIVAIFLAVLELAKVNMIEIEEENEDYTLRLTGDIAQLPEYKEDENGVS